MLHGLMMGVRGWGGVGNSNRGQRASQEYFFILFNQQYSGRYVSNISHLLYLSVCSLATVLLVLHWH